MQKCAPPTGYEGTVVNIEGATVAFWYIDTNGSVDGGWFVKNDATSGAWSYDEGTTDSGTWILFDGSEQGTWIQDEIDPSQKIASTFGYEGDSCGPDQPSCAEGLEC